MKLKQYTRHILILALAFSIGSLIGTALVFGTVTKDAQGAPRDDGDTRLVPTFDNIEEAEAAAGFAIYMPTFIPESYERGPISVERRGGNSDRVVVSQQWTSREERSNLRINQAPRTRLGGADKQSVIVRGKQGERLSGPASGGRPGELSILHWVEEGEMSITVVGFLKGSVSEDTLMQIAESLQTSN